MRATALGGLTVIGEELKYAAPWSVPPHSEKSPGAWKAPFGNVVCVSIGTASVLVSFPQACGPTVPAMPSHGTIC